MATTVAAFGQGKANADTQEAQRDVTEGWMIDRDGRPAALDPDAGRTKAPAADRRPQGYGLARLVWGAGGNTLQGAAMGRDVVISRDHVTHTKTAGDPGDRLESFGEPVSSRISGCVGGIFAPMKRLPGVERIGFRANRFTSRRVHYAQDGHPNRRHFVTN